MTDDNIGDAIRNILVGIFVIINFVARHGIAIPTVGAGAIYVSHLNFRLCLCSIGYFRCDCQSRETFLLVLFMLLVLCRVILVLVINGLLLIGECEYLTPLFIILEIMVLVYNILYLIQ